MLKKQVLLKLESNLGSPVSGVALGTEFNVSRTAIWKVISSLKEEGYPIISKGRAGYVLEEYSDILSKEGILANLDLDLDIHVHETLPSTSLTASALALEGCSNFTTVIANNQSQGRGRLGRSFYSPPSVGIYMSMVIKLDLHISKAMIITSAASVAIAKAIEEITGNETKIKWVNDIFVDNKKVCGILTEAISDFETGNINSIILGLGVNCRTTELPSELKDIVGFVNGDYSRNKLAATIITNLVHTLGTLDSPNFINEYKKRSLILNKEILVYKNGIKDKAYGVPATAIDFTPTAGLIVKYADGNTEALTSGEISISLK